MHAGHREAAAAIHHRGLERLQDSVLQRAGPKSSGTVTEKTEVAESRPFCDGIGGAVRSRAGSGMREEEGVQVSQAGEANAGGLPETVRGPELIGDVAAARPRPRTVVGCRLQVLLPRPAHSCGYRECVVETRCRTDDTPGAP